MLRNSGNPLFQSPCALALWGVLALSACSSKYLEVPPRLELAPYGRIALVTFSTNQGDTALTTFATQRFAEMVLESQPGVELLELGAADSSLGQPGPNADGSALAKKIGRQKDVPAVFLGYLKVSKVKPSGAVGDASGVAVQASVSAQLSVQLLSAQSGGTLWRSSATASGSVGQFAIGNGLPSIAVRDPDAAYGEVVRRLVTSATRDLRPTWVKQ